MEGIWDSVGPFVGAAEHGSNHADSNQLSQAPAEVDVRRQISAQRDGADFRSICDCQSLEDSPRDTTQDLADKERLDVGSREEDGDQADDSDKAAHHGLPVAITFTDPSVDHETNHLADVGTVAETCLPGSGNLISAVGGENAIFAVEHVKGVEVVDEGDLECGKSG